MLHDLKPFVLAAPFSMQQYILLLILAGGVALSSAQSPESSPSPFENLPSVFFGGTSSGSYAFATAGKQRPCESPFICINNTGHSTCEDFTSIFQLAHTVDLYELAYPCCIHSPDVDNCSIVHSCSIDCHFCACSPAPIPTSIPTSLAPTPCPTPTGGPPTDRPAGSHQAKWRHHSAFCCNSTGKTPFMHGHSKWKQLCWSHFG